MIVYIPRIDEITGELSKRTTWIAAARCLLRTSGSTAACPAAETKISDDSVLHMDSIRAIRMIWAKTDYTRPGKLLPGSVCMDVIGEIGLDYHYDDTDKEKQKTAFIRQLQLADRYRLPVSIHMRDATLDAMDDPANNMQRLPFILHCFSGSVRNRNGKR